MAWGLAAIIGAEPEYIEDSSMPAWLTLAEGVFQAQVARWDTGNCNLAPVDLAKLEWV